MLRFKSLGSGSSGTATIVQARGGTGITHLLVDCGLGLPQLDKRLQQAGMLADQIDGIFVTHEHGDHIGCARQLALRERIPVYMSQGTYFVRYVEPSADRKEQGFLAKLFKRDDPAVAPLKYRINLKSQGESTTVSVLNANGAPETSATAQRIVQVIADDLR